MLYIRKKTKKTTRIQSKGTKVKASDIKYLNSARMFLNERALKCIFLNERI